MVGDERRVAHAARPHCQDERLVRPRVGEDGPVPESVWERLAAHALLEEGPGAEHPVAVPQQSEEVRRRLAAREVRLVERPVPVDVAGLLDDVQRGERVEQDLGAPQVAAERRRDLRCRPSCTSEVVEHAELGAGQHDLGFLEARDHLEETVHQGTPAGRKVSPPATGWGIGA